MDENLQVRMTNFKTGKKKIIRCPNCGMNIFNFCEMIRYDLDLYDNQYHYDECPWCSMKFKLKLKYEFDISTASDSAFYKVHGATKFKFL